MGEKHIHTRKLACFDAMEVFSLHNWPYPAVDFSSELLNYLNGVFLMSIDGRLWSGGNDCRCSLDPCLKIYVPLCVPFPCLGIHTVVGVFPVMDNDIPISLGVSLFVSSPPKLNLFLDWSNFFHHSKSSNTMAFCMTEFTMAIYKYILLRVFKTLILVLARCYHWELPL